MRKALRSSGYLKAERITDPGAIPALSRISISLHFYIVTLHRRITLSGNLPMEWLMVGLELAVALIIALAVYLALKK